VAALPWSATMFEKYISSAEAAWLYAFFFSGDYPLALQLGIINGLCVIAIVLMRARRSKTDQVVKQGFMRSFAWLIIFANFFLILNKDYRFIIGLA
jgi:hypothetical protein